MTILKNYYYLIAGELCFLIMKLVPVGHPVLKKIVLVFPLSLLLVTGLLTSCKKGGDPSPEQPGMPGSWVQMNGPCDGGIASVAITGERIFAGVSLGGLYLSPDLGRSWKEITDPFPSYANVRSILIHHDTVLVTANGLFRSADLGQTWTALDVGILHGSMQSTSWQGEMIVLTGNNYGPVYISNDNGLSWKERGDEIPGWGMRGAVILGADIFVATDDYGMFRSTDNGETFTECNNGLGNIHLLSAAADGERIFAGTMNGLYVSSDHGESWSALHSQLLEGIMISELSVHGATLLAGSWAGLFYSLDHGSTWARAENGLTAQAIGALAADGSRFLAGTTGAGLFISETEGQDWRAIGLPITYVRQLLADGIHLFACASHWSSGIYQTTDGGQNWSYLYGVLPTPNIYSICLNGTQMIAGSDSGVFVSADQGRSWVRRSNGIAEGMVMSVAGDGPHLYAGTFADGLFVSHNGGQSWDKASLPVEDHLFVMCFSVGSEGVYAGTFCGGLLFSADHGATWNRVAGGLPEMLTVSSITRMDERLYLATYSGIYASSGNGSTWQFWGDPFFGRVVYGLATDGSSLYAGTAEQGVWKSAGATAAWTQITDNLPADLRIFCITVQGPWLFAGTDGKGVWRRPL